MQQEHLASSRDTALQAVVAIGSVPICAHRTKASIDTWIFTPNIESASMQLDHGLQSRVTENR